jgi:hypothetical protein
MGRVLDEVERVSGESLDRAAERGALASEIAVERRVGEIRFKDVGEEGEGRVMWMEMYRRNGDRERGWEVVRRRLRW